MPCSGYEQILIPKYETWVVLIAWLEAYIRFTRLTAKCFLKHIKKCIWIWFFNSINHTPNSNLTNYPILLLLATLGAITRFTTSRLFCMEWKTNRNPITLKESYDLTSMLPLSRHGQHSQTRRTCCHDLRFLLLSRVPGSATGNAHYVAVFCVLHGVSCVVLCLFRRHQQYAYAGRKGSHDLRFIILPYILWC